MNDLKEKSGAGTWLPALGWLRLYQVAWLRADVIAGITLAAYLLPSGLGDASLAGLPPEAGLYACLFPGLVFWLFCSSRHTSITVTSAISLLIGSSLGEIAGGDATRFAVLAAGTAVVVAALAFFAWLIRAGSIVNFISESVMVGFKSGVAFYLASTQLPKLFGFKGAHGNFWERMHHFATHIGDTHAFALGLGLSALAVLVAGKVFLKNKPVAILVVLGGIALSQVLQLEQHGVHLLGTVPQGLPTPGLPDLQSSDWNAVLPLAVACFLLGSVETAAIGRMFGAKHGTKFDPNREFLALASANLAAGLGSGYPVSGGLSQSLVNESSGARSPLSTLFASIIILVVCVFLSDLLRSLPQPVLAAVVLVAVASLFKVSALTHLWRLYRGEFMVAVAAFLGVLGSGLLRGVMIGALLSLVQLLRRASHPHVAILGRIPGTRRFSDRERNPENEAAPGVLAVRPETSLVYFNVEHVCEEILGKMRGMDPVPGLVVCDLSASPQIDSQSACALAGMGRDIREAGSRLQIVEARSAVRDLLRAEKLEPWVGSIDRLTSIADAVESHRQGGAT